jgi:hypothetical protein
LRRCLCPPKGDGSQVVAELVEQPTKFEFVINLKTASALATVSGGYTNPLMWWGAGPGAMQYIDHIAIGIRIRVGPPSDYVDLFDRAYPERFKLRARQLLLRNSWTCCHHAFGYQTWLDGRRRH